MCVGGKWSSPPHFVSPCPQERYYVLYIRPSCIHCRKFDSKGNEIEPNFSATRKVNTGFLMSSYSRYPQLFLPQGPLTVWLVCLLSLWAPLKWHLSMFGLDSRCLIRGSLMDSFLCHTCSEDSHCPISVPGARLAFPTPAISAAWQNCPQTWLWTLTIFAQRSRDPAKPRELVFLLESPFGSWALSLTICADTTMF